MQEVAEAVRSELDEGRGAVIGRVTELKGFSTLPVDELIAFDAGGRMYGDLLGRPGRDKLAPAAASLLGASGSDALTSVTVEIHGPQVAELGLACGGRADVLLQSAGTIPPQLWVNLAARSPVALITYIRGEDPVVVDRAGAVWGAGARDDHVGLAREMLHGGRSARHRVEDEGGLVALVEAWIPSPRLVVVGSGDVVSALDAQAGLLGWETRSTEGAGGSDAVAGLLDWAGATAALIVLSHDPHVDTDALAEGLGRGIPYVGAMGSRGTQSRRMERLAAGGVTAVDLDRIHKPIGLNLGGRRASEVALAIVAEVLACHYGRDAQPLKGTTGPIHG